MIKIDLITGFLGSGKTTFLIKYARYLMSQGMRIGILEYDYGAVNVDMLLLNKLRCDKCELEMVAAACDEDCLRRRFKTKLISMAMSGYDRIIIEPSGVFDMDLFFDSLREEPLENWYEIGSVITVVNANLSDGLTPEEDFFLASQAASAGSVVFSRVQQSDDERIQKTISHLENACNQIGIKKIRGKYIIKDWDTLLDEDFMAISKSEYFVNDYIKEIAGRDLAFSSLCYLDLPDDLMTVKKKVSGLFKDKAFGNIIRVKGFIADKEGGYQINATQYEMLVDNIAIGRGILIIIGTELNEEMIKNYINEKG